MIKIITKKLNSIYAGIRSKKKHLIIISIFLMPLLIFFSFIAVHAHKYSDKAYPNTYINEHYVGGLNSTQIFKLLDDNYKNPQKLTLRTDTQTFSIQANDLSFSYEHKKTARSAVGQNHESNLTNNINRILSSYTDKRLISLKYKLNEKVLDQHLSVIAGQISEPDIKPSVLFDNDSITIEKGRRGIQLDTEKTKRDIKRSLTLGKNFTIPLATKSTGIVLNEDQRKVLGARAEKISEKSIILNYQNYEKVLDGESLLSIISYNGTDNEKLEKTINTIKHDLNREPQNSVFIYEDQIVKEFVPSKNGLSVVTDELKRSVINSIDELESTDKMSVSFSIPVKETEPEITNDQVNNLGIKELIGKGSSEYKGSIASRVHNIGVAAEKISGSLIAPDEVFSFNNAVGDISSFTGYKQAYIIKDGQTILGDGGGVCQVSTTLFRAALDAGLPIVERRAHSYRVTYYEQDSPPGIDATIYAPTTDFKFKNDTGNHILIQSLYDPKVMTLDFEIYGTDDGRISTITEPVITSSSPPPEDLYIDDPTLPEGTIKQIDWKAWGAKVYFDYIVEKDGKTIYEKRFYSNFRPWQAKFLRGTGPST